jgi:hypothetical protein
MNFFDLNNPSGHRRVWRLVTHPIIEMSTKSRNLFLGTRAWLVCRADSLTAICELTVYTVWILNISQPYKPPRPVTRITLLLLLFFLLLFYFYKLSWGGGYNIYLKHVFYFQSDDANP